MKPKVFLINIVTSLFEFTIGLMKPEKSSKQEEEKIQNNPKYNYKAKHDLFISNYIAENLQYSILMVGVYGKLSHEKMEEYVNDLAARPHTSALLKDQLNDNSKEPFYEDKGAKQDIMKIDEIEDSEDDGGATKKDSKNDAEKKIKDLEKRLQKIQKENEKLKKNKSRGESS